MSTRGSKTTAPNERSARAVGEQSASDSQPATGGPEPFDLRSNTISGEKLRELLRLFPEARTEGDKVDYSRLKLALGESVDTGRERYGLTWPGKADCFKAIQTPSLGTLLPAPEESVNWDTTENLIIEGDNLEVLKLLQKPYLGKVKMIYIDPPYNTGSDFIYPDNYTESLLTYLEYTGQVDSTGKKFSTNTDTEGRFHSKWLNMMYPRLFLARNLLSEDGVLFVSIDDNEMPRLTLVCQEVFGETNVDVIVWRKTGFGRHGKMKNTTTFRKDHEYVLACFRNELTLRKLLDFPDFVNENAFDNPDSDPRGEWFSGSISRAENASNPRHENYYSVTSPSGTKWTRQWEVDHDEFLRLAKDNRIYWGERGDKVPRRKVFREERRETTPSSILSKGTTTEGTEEVEALVGEVAVSIRPKPVALVSALVQLGTDADSIVIDFFAGSGTTAHAVLEQNRVDSGSRKFILIQLPEPTPPATEATREGYTTIAEVCEERVRRVIKEMSTIAKNSGGLGFRVYKLAESNFKVWDSSRPTEGGALQRRLMEHVEHIRDGRTSQDLLTELLLKSGFPPTTPIREVESAGKKTYIVADGKLSICLDSNLSPEAMRAIADLKPERVVCLDEGFAGNDQLKINAAQTFKTRGIPFQTV